MKLLLIAAFCAITLTGVCAEEVRPTTFATLDADHDGRVSGAEAQVYNALSETFKNADLNVDGFVSESEYAQWVKNVLKPGARKAPAAAASVHGSFA